MEAGDCWQVSCVPSDFVTPDWAKGAVIYQIFPDRFAKKGECDLSGKLTPYVCHQSWEEEVFWQPTAEGLVLNNDFYGGNFKGIAEKMDYLAALGVEILYLNPISKSFSSHRYDTGDYKTPDPMLGTPEDFRALCDAAHEKNIKVILDGVFSHTGANSLYFDKYGHFGGKGAYADPQSPYRSWYQFRQYPDSYVCWWDFDTLPTVNKMDQHFIRYIITDADSVIAHWLNQGADGFRLDVADELPDAFLKLLKDRLRQLKPDALLMGEVWEDASNKIAYDVRRRYFTDAELDSCMNYPFRTAILDYVCGRDDGKGLERTVMTVLENYPEQVSLCNMNLLGTHDTMRVLTALVDDTDRTRQQAAVHQLSDEQRVLAKQRLCVASFLQYMLPGCPSIYYGDEAGMEGGKDPFNRRTFPWGREDAALLQHFIQLGKLRQNPALRLGRTGFFAAEKGKLGFSRHHDGKSLQIYVNCGSSPWEIPSGKVLYSSGLRALAPKWLSLAPMGYCILED
jgi:glycosidase